LDSDSDSGSGLYRNPSASREGRIRRPIGVRVRYDSRGILVGKRVLSRSLVGFLFFCLLLGAAGLFLVWYVGPTATRIAFDADRREAPYFLLQLIPQSATAGPDAVPQLRAGLLAAVGADGGRRIWTADETRRHESRARHGSYRGAMAAVDLFAFDRASDLVQMLTGEEFRALAAVPDPAALLVGTSVPPQSLRPGEVAVMVLYENVDPETPLPLGEAGDSGWLVALTDHSGRVAWDTPIDWIRGSEEWNRLVLLQFPDAASASAWLRDPATLSGRALASRYLGDLLVLAALPRD